MRTVIVFAWGFKTQQASSSLFRIQHQRHPIRRSECIALGPSGTPISLIDRVFLTKLREDELPTVELEKQQLREAIAKYQERTQGTKFHANLDLDKVHTWDEVLEAVNEASQQYEEPKGHWGRIRKSLRKFGRDSRAFDAWAQTLPSQSQYFSIICGGLKLIFGVSCV